MLSRKQSEMKRCSVVNRGEGFPHMCVGLGGAMPLQVGWWIGKAPLMEWYGLNLSDGIHPSHAYLWGKITPGRGNLLL